MTGFREYVVRLVFRLDSLRLWERKTVSVSIGDFDLEIREEVLPLAVNGELGVQEDLLGLD